MVINWTASVGSAREYKLYSMLRIVLQTHCSTCKLGKIHSRREGILLWDKASQCWPHLFIYFLREKMSQLFILRFPPLNKNNDSVLYTFMLRVLMKASCLRNQCFDTQALTYYLGAWRWWKVQYIVISCHLKLSFSSLKIYVIYNFKIIYTIR